MRRLDKKDIVGVVVILLMFSTLVGLVTLCHKVAMRPHTNVGYVIGYTHEYYVLGGAPMTKIQLTYRVMEIGPEDELVVDIDELTYGGHHDFVVGKLYRIESEGNFWWRCRSITHMEIVKEEI